MTQTTPAEQHMLELHRIHRTVDLNVRYYGARAAVVKRLDRNARIAGAVGSSTAIIGVVAGWPAGVLFLSAVTALSTILASLFLWEQQTVLFERLHFSYCDLLHEFKNHIREISLDGNLTPERQAVSRVLFNRYSRLGSQDEINPHRSLIAEFEAEVKKAIPADSLWMPPAA